VLDGSVRSDETGIKLILKLTDTRTGHQIWSESSRSSIEAARLIAYQEDLARSIAVKIAGERGWIMKTLAKESKRRPPQHSTVYEAVLRYIEYDVTFTPEAFSRALAALEKAVIIDPEYGPTWSMLARLYADIYTFDIPGFKDPLEKAFEFAQTGTRLSLVDQRCSAIMAYIHFVRNDLAAGLAEAERALSLGPATLFLLDGIGFLMTLMGDWERGPALIKNVIQLNPFYGNYVHFSLWVDCIRQKDYAGAYQESLKLNAPALFLDHVARASTLGLLGNIEDGRKAAAELLKLKPDFAARGRILIRHYIKFDDIFERVIKGLKAVGLEVR
jgi:tetratricopeptide (TPR) repeat protein